MSETVAWIMDAQSRQDNLEVENRIVATSALMKAGVPPVRAEALAKEWVATGVGPNAGSFIFWLGDLIDTSEAEVRALKSALFTLRAEFGMVP